MFFFSSTFYTRSYLLPIESGENGHYPYALSEGACN
jgi:hypothetical protein